MKVLSFIQSAIWAMREQEFEQMLHIAARHGDTLERLAIAAESDKNFETLMKQKGDDLGGTRYVSTRDSIAVIDLNGTISKRMNYFSDLCDGGVSTEILMRDFNAALVNPAISAIVFNIDSGGGEAFGINEFAQAIYKARGKKPIKAYVSGLGCSGAYWIASACDEIICDKSALLGSIGVVSVWMDDTKFYQSLGIDKKVVTSSNAPKKRLDLNTDEGMTEFLRELDGIESVFIEAVARNRNTTKTKVISDFNQGGVLAGSDAVRVGMADRVGSLEQVLSELFKKPTKSNASTSKAAFQGEEMDMSFMDKMKQFVGLADEIKPLLEAESSTETPEAKIEASGNSQPTAEFLAMKRRAELAEREKGELLESRKKEIVNSFAAQAKTFTAEQVKAGKLFPAEVDGFEAAYCQALNDDLNSPLAVGSRVAHLEGAQTARTPHKFFAETLAPGATAQILVGEQSDQISEERKTELLSQTPLGRTALKVVTHTFKENK